jgi:hypothetical protein
MRGYQLVCQSVAILGLAALGCGHTRTSKPPVEPAAAFSPTPSASLYGPQKDSRWVDGNWERGKERWVWRTGYAKHKRGYVQTRGHWRYSHGMYIWEPGRLVRAQKNRVWARGHYEWRNGRYHWQPGHWVERRAGKYWHRGHYEEGPRGRKIWIDGRWRDTPPLLDYSRTIGPTPPPPRGR